MGPAKEVNIYKWIDDHNDCFKPPVCNKLLHDDQLKVQFVGGPNIRDDFHLEAGDELFYQVRGEMNLKVVEDGAIRDKIIKEGYMYMIPCHTYHSPQRYVNTVGLVVERLRAPHEYDSIRYFINGSVKPLWERWFHLENLEEDLPPVFKQFNVSKAKQSGQPGDDSFVADPAYHANIYRKLGEPFDFKEWIDTNRAKIKSEGFVALSGPPTYQMIVRMYGSTAPLEIDTSKGETFLLNWGGHVTVTCNGEKHELATFFDSVLIPQNAKSTIKCDTDGLCFAVQSPTP